MSYRIVQEQRDAVRGCRHHGGDVGGRRGRALCMVSVQDRAARVRAGESRYKN